jgi:2'-5' RNA ligase
LELEGAVRTFIAVELPQHVKAALEEVQKELKETGADVRWVRPESIHLTLKFLGEIDEESVVRIRKVMEGVASAHRPFEVEVKGMGCFPNLKQPRVIWVGVLDRQKALASLQEGVEEAVGLLGFEREERPFRPHLTLGRVRTAKGRQALLERMGSMLGQEFGTFEVHSVILFKSDLHPSGARYTPLWEMALGG